VIYDALAARILVGASKRASGVVPIDGWRFHAKAEVVTSCGTQQTPQILMFSGIGPQGELARHNIPPAV